MAGPAAVLDLRFESDAVRSDETTREAVCAWLAGLGLKPGWMPGDVSVVIDADAGTITTQYVVPEDEAQLGKEIPNAKAGADGRPLFEPVTVPLAGGLPDIPPRVRAASIIRNG